VGVQFLRRAPGEPRLNHGGRREERGRVSDGKQSPSCRKERDKDGATSVNKRSLGKGWASPQMMQTSGVAAARNAYIAKGCPATSGTLPTGGHIGPVLDQLQAAGSGSPNYMLMEVGGFSASATTSNGTTTFTLTNTSGQASFSGATTLGSFIAGQLPGPQNLLGTADNPFGPTGPAHNVNQTFSWAETGLCK